MSRKDYVALAAAIHDTKIESAEILGAFSVLKRAASRVADALSADNHNFDRERFLTACGFPPGKEG